MSGNLLISASVAALASARGLRLCMTCIAAVLVSAAAPLAAASDPVDARIRLLVYDADEVYRLRGYVGYQIDLEFESGETFVGLGSGDLDGLSFAAQDNHLFVKPRAGGTDTNITVLTTRRTYHFDYSSSELRADGSLGDVVYVLRFIYPPQHLDHGAATVEHELTSAPQARPHNLNYGYHGSSQLKPVSAWDDGIQTHVRFDSHEELPAIFVHNDDGSESLLNFTMDGAEVVVHRIARRLSVRRGGLQGCILNQNYGGSGQRLDSETISPSVERTTRQRPP